ncbi:hypothetical protein LOZ58_003120 [Ophidiomyces ophidiicola]|nr:hypothetical protein LOZ66_003151 [Ophidiomyces ophidiicola]KAI1962041.1 hypothetical protein LOZ58_003120 [Ophidiomyces ophidiicola]
MNYFHQIYLSHANSVVTDYITRGRRDQISRAKIEAEILKEIDKSELPSAYRIAWFALVLQTNTFDIYWLGQRNQHHLSRKSIARLKPDLSLINECVYESPESSPDASDDELPASPGVEASTEIGPPIPDSSSSDDDSSSDREASSETLNSSPPPRSGCETQGVSAEAAVQSIEGQTQRPQYGGKSLPEVIAATVTGATRKITPGRALSAQRDSVEPTHKGRKSTRAAATPKKPKATRMKAPPKKRRDVAAKMPKIAITTTIDEVDEDGNIPDPASHVETPAPNNDNADTDSKEAAKWLRSQKAWETRRRRAAERAATAAKELAEEQGNGRTFSTVSASAAGTGAGKARGRKNKTVRFNIPEGKF